MMRRFLPIIICAALAAALAAGYFTLRAADDPARTGILYSLGEAEEIETVSVENAYGTFVFFRTGGAWAVLMDGAEYRVYQTKMDLMLSALSAFTVERVLEEERDSYGFSQPAAKVAFTTSEGGTHSFIVGGGAADASSVYVKELGKGRSLITDSASVAQFTGSLAAYRDKEVFTIEIASLKRIEYYRGGEKVLACFNETTSAWYMDYPFESQARHIELNELLASMMGWTVSSYPDPALTAADMGLDAPAETIVLTDGNGKTQTIGLGNVNGTERYARIGGEDDIVALYAVDVDLSVMEPDKLLFVAPLKATLDQVRKISVSVSGKHYELTYDPNTEIGTLNGRYIGYEDFVSVFFKYISLTAAGRDETGGAGARAASFTTVFSDGAEARMELFERDGDTYFMRLSDGSTEYFLRAEKLSALMERIEAIETAG